MGPVAPVAPVTPATPVAPVAPVSTGRPFSTGRSSCTCRSCSTRGSRCTGRADGTSRALEPGGADRARCSGRARGTASPLPAPPRPSLLLGRPPPSHRAGPGCPILHRHLRRAGRAWRSSCPAVPCGPAGPGGPTGPCGPIGPRDSGRPAQSQLAGPAPAPPQLEVAERLPILGRALETRRERGHEWWARLSVGSNGATRPRRPRRPRRLTQDHGQSHRGHRNQAYANTRSLDPVPRDPFARMRTYVRVAGSHDPAR